MRLIPEKYEKYLRFFKFIVKYWDNGILEQNETIFNEFLEEKKDDFNHSPEEFVSDLKLMGPTYIKLGQLLSTRPDLLPDKYLKALSSLQDDIEPFSYEEVEKIFREEIGQRISKAFQFFDPKPLASASIGQVHTAILHSGEKVAVKIQRPNIREEFVNDLETLMDLSEKAEQYNKTARKFSIHNIIEELQYMLFQELDYKIEAQNLITLKQNLKSFNKLIVPAPINDFCSHKILTMEFIDGHKVTNLSRLVIIELPVIELIDDFIKGYLKQIIIDGFAHADPHPGNISLTEDGKLALMDLGMVARFSDPLKEVILKLMIALSNNDGTKVAGILLGISRYDSKEANFEQFKKIIIRKTHENQNSKAKDLKTGRLILEMNKIAANNGIHFPSELSILGKILLNMDQIIASLAPDYSIQQTIRNYTEELMEQRIINELKSGYLLQTLLESKELIENLPYRLNKFTENLADNKIKLQVDAIDETRFTVAFQKVANRITIGLIITSMILGATLMMSVPTSWTLWGYPGFAILLFIFAASIGLYFIYLIIFKDETDKK